jgi:hypothetical protein
MKAELVYQGESSERSKPACQGEVPNEAWSSAIPGKPKPSKNPQVKQPPAIPAMDCDGMGCDDCDGVRCNSQLKTLNSKLLKCDATKNRCAMYAMVAMHRNPPRELITILAKKNAQCYF